MDAIGPELRWTVVAILLGFAAVIIHLARRRILLLAAALLISPVPALLFLRTTIKLPAGAPEDQLNTGFLLSILACYLAPALGALTAHLVNGATERRRHVSGEPSLDGP